MRKRLYRAGLAWLMAVGVALLLRWLYVVWPNTLTAVLTPVSASPWEWGKALYWPVLAALLLLHRAEMRAGLMATGAIGVTAFLARQHREHAPFGRSGNRMGITGTRYSRKEPFLCL